ncbi:acetyltransferase [Mesorhizobium australicum WSM2073]|uniref:Acetyltransferase n=5 Tax=Phyllobacteriaceae TaxID=69277 RepID=L0KVS3_MESAW|nr:GCN5-related N-acetyltransferase [Mesorhizobium ciceri biovar biserrulae WSM1271]AEH90803.1 GCN5-related N-acetyltransferase [Mesorhizobium opportunistum WSM2075]AGB48173.1 acetyltransferase [Mesorhizobium australicum WSM2073]OBP84724.1 acetyltransferase [Mesorhizobium loti]
MPSYLLDGPTHWTQRRSPVSFTRYSMNSLAGKRPRPTSSATVLANAGAVAVIASEGGEPAGIIVLNECTAIYAGGKFGQISELYVRPEMRSKGIAPCLLEVALQEGRARGWKRLEVGAPAQPKCKRTLDFYLRDGFEEVGPRLRRTI